MNKYVEDDIKMVFATIWHDKSKTYEQDKKQLTELISHYDGINSMDYTKLYLWFDMCWKNKLWIYKKPKDRKNIRRY